MMDGDGDGSFSDDSSTAADLDWEPASSVAIARLPETTVGEAWESGQCVVCLEEYKAGDALRTMPCNHGFHERCIFQWLRASRLCPLCRFALPPPEEDDTDTETDKEDEREAGHHDDNGGGGALIGVPTSHVLARVEDEPDGPLEDIRFLSLLRDNNDEDEPDILLP